MIKYGDTTVTDLTFVHMEAELELKSQWIHVYLQFQLAEGQSFPAGLTDPSALIVSTYEGTVIEYVVLDEGCDSEFQFTEHEKQQIATYIKERVSKHVASKT